MKRLLAVVVAVAVFATCVMQPVLGQDAANVTPQRKAYVLSLKTQIKQDVERHPQSRVLIEIMGGPKVVGRIREVHDDNFVLDPGGKQAPRTIAYAELMGPPRRVPPMAEKIAKDTGFWAVFIICSPIILLGYALGWVD